VQGSASEPARRTTNKSCECRAAGAVSRAWGLSLVGPASAPGPAPSRGSRADQGTFSRAHGQTLGAWSNGRVLMAGATRSVLVLVTACSVVSVLQGCLVPEYAVDDSMGQTTRGGAGGIVGAAQPEGGASTPIVPASTGGDTAGQTAGVGGVPPGVSGSAGSSVTGEGGALATGGTGDMVGAGGARTAGASGVGTSGGSSGKAGAAGRAGAAGVVGGAGVAGVHIGGGGTTGGISSATGGVLGVGGAAGGATETAGFGTPQGASSRARMRRCATTRGARCAR
jgi:hypothetical protein